MNENETKTELTREDALLLDDCIKCFCEKCEEVDVMKRKLRANLELASAIYNWERCKAATALRHKLWNMFHPETKPTE
jgi:hypothetical protein